MWKEKKCYRDFSDMLKALDTIDYVKKTDIFYGLNVKTVKLIQSYMNGCRLCFK